MKQKFLTLYFFTLLYDDKFLQQKNTNDTFKD